MRHEEVSALILKGFYAVYNNLGAGFLEKVYENAMVLELRQEGLDVEQQEKIPVYYRGSKIGEYFADLIVNGIVVVELKAAEFLKAEHFAQLTHYLKATDKELGLLLNFGRKPEFKRVIFTNDQKLGLPSKDFGLDL